MYVYTASAVILVKTQCREFILVFLRLPPLPLPPSADARHCSYRDDETSGKM